MKIVNGVIRIIFFCVIILLALHFFNLFRENELLKKIIDRLSADSRVAEVVVKDVKVNPQTKVAYTTIRFVEYDSKGEPLTPKYFTFSSNIIQFQSLVIRFDDFYVKKGHPLKGKSVYLFMKVFALKDNGAEVFEINEINEAPSGYRIKGKATPFEKRLWHKFWQYALSPKEADRVGIKNAQIEAPGTKFIPGMLYTLKIEHDGGMRVDVKRRNNVQGKD